MPTLPNGVATPLVTDSADPVSMLTTVANGFSDAIGGLGSGKRQPRMLSVANQVEKTALTSLMTAVSGDQVFVQDTAWFEMFLSGVWKVVKTTSIVSYSPSFVGIIPGNGVSTFSYSLDGDIVSFRGNFVFGSTTTFTGAATGIYLPFACNYVTTGTAEVVLGTAMMLNPDNSYVYQGIAKVHTDGSGATLTNLAATLWFDINWDPGNLTPTVASSPYAIGAGSQFSVDLRYVRKM